ncbi:MAG: hypothetical protein CL843_12045 [Crocinitomicaceae bacterium]|nr:hypothetical protein [Crocinitomicaceae bacterium]|tara:strand:+ start:1931 stop:4240 length:2310 start_codon:yes stop_codon:yes gene_type:complete
MSLRVSFVILLVIFCQQLFAQEKYSISGYVRDASTGEYLIGATVLVQELPGVGSSTNTYGFYSITLEKGEYTLVINFLGLSPQTRKITLDKDLELDFNLEENSTQLNEVVISAEKADENLRKPEMGVEKIEMQDLDDIPVLMGEKDVLKTIQLKPGVKAAGEGSSGFFVRGGKADQNLILLDEATVYNASHLLGFFSVFNADALKSIKLYKGTQPAEYGGRLSSVMDIHMKEGNNQKFGVSGGIGLIASRLSVEGPIVKGKGSFSIAGRRTYADMFLKATEDYSDASLYFYDINAKANYQLSKKDRIYFSGYFGKDVFGMEDMVGFDWGNTTATLRWNHLFNNKLFSNTSFIFSNYNYNIDINIRGIDAQIVSTIQDFNLKQDFQYYANAKNTLKFGFNSIHHTIVPGEITTSSGDSDDLSNSYAWENALYASHNYKPNDVLTFEYGLRFSAFSNLGAATYYDYDVEGNTIDSTQYSSGEFANTYFNLEPRLTVNYLINNKSSVKFAYGRNAQYLHLLSNSTSGSPTDMWIPSTPNVKPEIADQLSIGYFRNFKNNSYEFSIEGYYKYLQNQIDYKDGAELQFNNNVESELLYGEGRAYGIELLINKKKGRLHGWVSYTLSKTENKINGINNGDYYPSMQNRTHDLSIVAMYDLTDKWTLSASWVFYTGNAVTFPSGKYEIAGEVVNYYTERNGYNMPDYHRLDLGATWQVKKNEKFESSWNFSLYNAYGRENAYMITFEEDPDDASKTQAVQTSLFRWIPSITYNFKF